MRVAIVPAGQWGTALAVPLLDNGHSVRLWLRDPAAAAQFAATRTAPRLPGVALGPGAMATAHLAEALEGADLVVLGPASHALRAVCRQVAPHLPPGALVLSIVKGLEPDTLLRMSEVIAQEIPAAGRLAVLSGPNFAGEVARRLPAGTVVASRDPAVARWVQDALMTPRFRVYTSADVVGVELGGALKNVMAIGVGISDGLGMGDNARAALITRGIAEMARLGAALGASPLTFSGLSGVGDLVLTCTGDQSRNRRLGLAIGRGQPLAQVLAGGQTVEGVPTARAALRLAERVGVEMPIVREIHAVLFEGKDPLAALADLMGREKTQE